MAERTDRSNSSNRSDNSGVRRNEANRRGRGARAGGAGRGGHQPALAARARRETPQVIGTPVPQELVDVFNNLKYLADTITISAATLTQFKEFMQQLHGAQSQIEMALRLHAGQEPLPALCRAMLRLVENLDAALQGEVRREDYEPASEPARDRLPLNSLEIEDVEKLCLGLSALAYSHHRQPFPAEEFGAACKALASLTKKLIGQANALGGEKSLADGQLLNIGNMPRRFLAGRLIDVWHKDQQATLIYMKEEFKTFCAWAKEKHALDGAHNLGKTASQVLSMVDVGLATDVKGLAMVLAWLLRKESLATMREEGNTVALSSVVSLVTRLLQKKKFKPGNRDLDKMWFRLAASIAALDAKALVGGDGRTLASYANLLAEMLGKDLPTAWQTAYDQLAKKDDARAKKLLDLIRQFDDAISNVLGAICDPAFKRLADLQSLSVLLKFMVSLSRQGSHACQASFQAAAAALLGTAQIAQYAQAVEHFLRAIQELRKLDEQECQRTLAAIRHPVRARHAKETDEEISLQLEDEDDASLHARCTRPPELVGGSLARTQQSAPKPEPAAQAPLLPHALTVAGAEQFREARRVARERAEDALPSWIPIPVPAEESEQEGVPITTTTNTTTTTTTTTTTRITTTTAIGSEVATINLTGKTGKRVAAPAGKGKQTRTFTKQQRDQLIAAISNGNTHAVRSMLASGIAAALSMDQRRQCLRQTVENARPEMLVLLLEEESFLPALDATTVTGGNLLKWALAGAATEEFSDQQRGNFKSIASHLILHGEMRAQAWVCDIHGRDVLMGAVAMNRIEDAELLLRYPEFRNLIGNEDKYGSTPLMMAVLNASLPMVQALLKCEEAKATLGREWKGMLPLESAAMTGKLEIFKLLWSHYKETDKNIARFKRPPMAPMAAISGEPEMVRHVLGMEEFQATAGDADKIGTSALLYALMQDSPGMVSELLKSPAVCASLFKTFKAPPPGGDIYKQPPFENTDAVTLAISKGGGLADLMLGLPQVQMKLYLDQAFSKNLIAVAEDAEHFELRNKLLHYVRG